MATWKDAVLGLVVPRRPKLGRPSSPRRRTAVECGSCLDETGSSAIEFALIFPVFIALVFGMFQFGYMFFVENSINAVTQQAARSLALGLDDTRSTETWIRRNVARFTETLTVEIIQPTATDADVTVIVRVPMASLALAGLFAPILADGTLEARSVFRTTTAR